MVASAISTSSSSSSSDESESELSDNSSFFVEVADFLALGASSSEESESSELSSLLPGSAFFAGAAFLAEIGVAFALAGGASSEELSDDSSDDDATFLGVAFTCAALGFSSSDSDSLLSSELELAGVAVFWGQRRWRTNGIFSREKHTLPLAALGGAAGLSEPDSDSDSSSLELASLAAAFATAFGAGLAYANE